jgi:hypothetical protein
VASARYTEQDTVSADRRHGHWGFLRSLKRSSPSRRVHNLMESLNAVRYNSFVPDVFVALCPLNGRACSAGLNPARNGYLKRRVTLELLAEIDGGGCWYEAVGSILT